MDQETPPRPRRRFSLRMAFLLTLVVAVTAAVYGGLLRENDRERFVFLAVAAPLGLLVLLGFIRDVARFWRQR